MSTNATSRWRHALRRLMSLASTVACLSLPAPAVAQDQGDPMAATVAQWFTGANSTIRP